MRAVELSLKASTVEKLKQQCLARRLSAIGRKADLINRICRHMLSNLEAIDSERADIHTRSSVREQGFAHVFFRTGWALNLDGTEFTDFTFSHGFGA